MVVPLIFVLLLGLSVAGAVLCRGGAKQAVGLAGVVGMAALAVILALSPDSIGSVTYTIASPQNMTISFGTDGLTQFFLILEGVLFAIGAIYGTGYLSHYKKSEAQTGMHWASFVVTLSGIVMLLTTRDTVVFLVGWEMMAIGSFMTVIFEYEKQEVIKAGTNYLIQSHIAVLLLTAVFMWSYSVTGGTSYESLRAFFAGASKGEQIVAMSMLIAGFGFKAGIVPFHSWLPFAHPAAPSHISALMSGVIVKAGIYGIVRFGSMMTEGHYAIGLTLLVLGVVSGLYGISNAAANRDFKRVLAYCTIENVGIISMGIGLGFIGLSQGHQLIMYLGFGSCLLHTMNHALFKSLLFMSVGNVYTQMHTRDMETLGGIGKYMSKTQALFLTGSVAIAGMPPFGGFISELMLYGGLLMGFQSESLTLSVIMALSGIGLAIIGGISLMAFSKAFSVIFLGTPRTEYAHKPKEVSNTMLIPAYCILALMVATIIYVPVLVPKLSGIANELVYESGDASIEHMGELLDMMLGNIGTIGQVAIGFGALTGIIVTLLTIRHFVTARSAQETGPTWGCGYEAPLVKAQYTGVSFVGTFQEMCKAILPQTKHYKPLNEEEIFPHRRNYISVESDVVDDRVITPMTGALRGGLGKFEFIENGNLQRYIVYGLGYVLLLVAASFIG